MVSESATKACLPAKRRKSISAPNTVPLAATKKSKQRYFINIVNCLTCLTAISPRYFGRALHALGPALPFSFRLGRYGILINSSRLRLPFCLGYFFDLLLFI